MFFFCLMLAATAGEVAWLPVDEINVRLLGPAAQNGPLVMITNFGRDNSSLTLFDFTQGKARTLDDGRLRILMARPLPHEKGFAVIGTVTGVLYFIDGNGQFQDQKRLRDLPGWEDSFRVRQACPGPDGTAYLTLFMARERELLLGELDLTGLRLTLLANRPAHENHEQAWVANGDKIYFFDSDSGRIDREDSAGFVAVETVRRGREPFRKENPRPRRSPFHALLEAPLIGDGCIYFRLHLYRDAFGNKLPAKVTKTLALDDTGVTECEVLPYGSFQGQSLIFDWREGEFRLLSTPHACR